MRNAGRGRYQPGAAQGTEGREWLLGKNTTLKSDIFQEAGLGGILGALAGAGVAFFGAT